jgi:DNA-binding XRE family transcriptional regulator
VPTEQVTVAQVMSTIAAFLDGYLCSHHAEDPLALLVQHLPRDRERMGLSEGHMAWLLGLTRRQYRELEAGRLNISYELYERICEVCGWPR